MIIYFIIFILFFIFNVYISYIFNYISPPHSNHLRISSAVPGLLLTLWTFFFFYFSGQNCSSGQTPAPRHVHGVGSGLQPTLPGQGETRLPL